MKRFLSEIYSELKLVFSGKSIDILIPPILFLLLNNIWSINIAIIGSTLLGILFLIKRIFLHENIWYAIGGLFAIIVANLSIYLSKNSNNYFLTDLAGTLGLIIITFISLMIKKPLAIWVSHITRGWDLKWFYRKDVMPAYREVTIFWLFFFMLRFSIELHLYLTETLDTLVIYNVILGFPVLILILTLSYIYGITRLKKLKGPGIDEFRNQTPPPWRGQTKGF